MSDYEQGYNDGRAGKVITDFDSRSPEYQDGFCNGIADNDAAERRNFTGDIPGILDDDTEDEPQPDDSMEDEPRGMTDIEADMDALKGAGLGDEGEFDGDNSDNFFGNEG